MDGCLAINRRQKTFGNFHNFYEVFSRLCYPQSVIYMEILTEVIDIILVETSGFH
ncbi:19472_t:CDS:2 [Funneliformis geosporum]|uniref:19472_t:CDS:1 n=1 Tax=Funneliformis geosporum TaxID=1117311 RepID=A0A9W4WRC6_9GLOM|nr:19472_t:CDS:2 [Funneliformis geosporum]